MSKLHRTVLVIDDATQNYDDYKNQLQQDATFSYQVLTRKSDSSIPVLCRSRQIDGILFHLADLRSSRFQILDQLKQQMGELCPPIVVIGSGDAEIAVQAFKHGAVDYLVKNRMTPEDLRLTMRSVIENAELRRELQRSQERFHTSVENMLDCFGIFSSIRDEAGQIVDFRIDYLNEAACENNQLPKAMQIGKGLCEILSAHRETGLFDHYCQVVETGEPLIKDSLIYEDAYDGQRLVRAFDIRATRLNDGFVASWRDITDRKRIEEELNQTAIALQASEQSYRNLADARQDTEQALRAVNQKFSNILDSMTDAVAVLDRSWRFTYVNQAAIDMIGYLTQLDPEEWLTKTHWELFPSLVGQPIEHEYRRAIAEQVSVQLEVFYEVTGNWFEVRAYPSLEGLTIYCRAIDDRKQTEIALRDSQAQLQQQLAEIEVIYQSAPIGLTVFDRDLRFVRINQRLAEINGISVEEHIGHSVRELLPDLADAAEALLRPILETGEPRLNVEIHGETPAQPGVQRTWLEHFLPLKDGDRIIGISTVCQEITDRKRTEAALRESEEFKRRMLESSHDCIKVLDLNARLLYMNPGGQSLLEIDEFSCFQNVEWTALWQGEDRARAEQAIAMVKAGRMGRFQGYCPTARGNPKWWDVVLTPIQDLEGQLIQILAISRDITEQKLAEEALRQSQERLKLGMQVSGFALARVDYATNTIELSPEAAALYGLPTDELVVPRSRLHATFHPEDQAELACLIDQVLDPTGSGWFAQDHRVVWQTGEVRWLTVRKQVFFDRSIPSAQPTDAILVALDITERKQAEQEREHLLAQEQAAREAADRANGIKDEFLAILSHELRTPLNPILGWVQLLRTRQFDAARTAEALSTIERNAKLQMQLVDDLLDIAKILRGKLTLEPQPIDLSAIVSAAIETVQTAANAKSIVLHAVLPEIGQVMGDEGRLQQVVWNLLSNAIKFTPTGGQVTIQLEQVGNEAVITVSDTGKGITPDFLPHLFESFRQEDASTTRKYGGLGLGLAIVRQLVEAHGGTITADSAGEGQGATFTVRLPVLKMQAKVIQPSVLPTLELDLTGIRILAVDDDADSRDLIAVLLREYGAEVRVVESAAEVLLLLESFQPNVLISDIGMPEMDGYELIRRVRSRPAENGGQVSAIALTAYAKEDDQRRALLNGYQRHMSKPLDAEHLVQVVMALAVKSG